jgi:hypothetical protein
MMKKLIAVVFGLFLSLNILAQTKTTIPKDWEKFSNNFFSFYAPSTLKGQSGVGTDSFVGKYKNEAMTIGFDYGSYENDTGNCSDSISATIDKKRAKICFYKDKEIDKDKPFVTAIAFPKLGKGGYEKLTFWVRSKTKELQKEAEKIVRSIKFE